jgi:hypothetical protein
VRSRLRTSTVRAAHRLPLFCHREAHNDGLRRSAQHCLWSVNLSAYAYAAELDRNRGRVHQASMATPREADGLHGFVTLP